MAAQEAERICRWLVDTHGIIADGLLAQITDTLVSYEERIIKQQEIIEESSQVIGKVRLRLEELARIIDGHRRTNNALRAEIKNHETA